VSLTIIRGLVRPRLYAVTLSGLIPYSCRPKTTGLNTPFDGPEQAPPRLDDGAIPRSKTVFQHFKIAPRKLRKETRVYCTPFEQTQCLLPLTIIEYLGNAIPSRLIERVKN